MANYKGYDLRKENGVWNVYTWYTNDGGRTKRWFRTAGGYPNKLTAQRACDAHFGRL